MPDSYAEAHYPKGGIDLSRAFWDQRPREVEKGLWAKSTAFAQNVRVYEPDADRSRGGSRPGLGRAINARTDGTDGPWMFQSLNSMTVAGTSVQVSQQGRRVILVAVDRGRVFNASAGDTVWVEATNLTAGTPPLNYVGIVRSSVINQLMFFADGINECYYEPSTNTVKPWTASSGQMPRGSDNGKPRLICTWRGRLVVSGLFADSENVFFSAVGEPTTWSYFPPVTTATQAVALNIAPQGLVGDPVYSLVPYSDDLLVIGGSTIIKVMSGDPMANGQLDLVSDQVGFAWGEPWTKTPDGTLFFVSNKAGIYAWKPGRAPQRISQPVEQLIQAVDTGLTGIRLGYDQRYQAIHFFLTPLSEPTPATHLTLELRTNSWSTLKLKNDNHNPLALCTYDGNREQDRVLMVGSWDGYVRAFQPTAEDDDGTVIESEVWIGPLTTKDFDSLLTRALVADLGEDSGAVTWAVYTGSTAEAARASSPVLTGTWTAGRNRATPIRRSGHALYIRLTSTNRWALERVRAEVATQGKVQSRSKGA